MIQLAPDLLPIVALGVLELADVHNTEHESRLDAPLAAAEQAARARPPGHPSAAAALGTLPAARAAVRAMYRAVGIDPTKRRPSSEALLRRVMRGDALPRINTLVDICNWCSFEFQLPYGLYDRDRIEGPIVLRLGDEGEQYAGIRKDVVHVAGRLTLADGAGAFGNPTADSARTMVTIATRRALAVIFAPRELAATAVASALDATAERAQAFTGAREIARSVV